jgi:hypothetical protein
MVVSYGVDVHLSGAEMRCDVVRLDVVWSRFQVRPCRHGVWLVCVAWTARSGVVKP